MDVVSLKDWGFPLNAHGLLLIAGPCSAESEQQVLATAHGLRNMGIGLFRAGVWKPRTRPGTFEGMGEQAFRWLDRMREETGLGYTVEVANARHVDIALEHGADALWVGARTTVTPFAVQEIADALRGVDIPVLVKNPMHPDLELWLGALERLSGVGIKRLGAILRGVSGLPSGKYRNAPAWNMAFELQRRLPGIGLLCDPSHISGSSDLVKELCQNALNLAFGGLMIEVHDTPECALSDRFQQVTPSQLDEILGSLVYKNKDTDSADVQAGLAVRRLELDQIDDNLLELLARRMTLSREIGELKKAGQMTVLQSERWEQALNRALEQGRKLGLSEDFLKDVFDRIHLASIAEQQ